MKTNHIELTERYENAVIARSKGTTALITYAGSDKLDSINLREIVFTARKRFKDIDNLLILYNDCIRTFDSSKEILQRLYKINITLHSFTEARVICNN